MKINKLKCRPILVESKDTSSTIVLDDNSRKLNLCKPHEALWGHKEFVLISLEEEKIEEGDIVIWKSQLFTVNSNDAYSNTNNITIGYCNQFKLPKVIARQSQISPEYIAKFIEQYNSDCVEDFEVEMEDWCDYDDDNTWGGLDKSDWRIKLTNGFITIVEKESDNFIKFLKERIDKASSTETKAAYTIVLEQYKKEILYTEEEVLNMIDKYDEAKWGCPARKGMEEITFWFNKNKKK